jgi:hypothetical protein
VRITTKLEAAENRAAIHAPERGAEMHLRYGLNIGDQWRELERSAASKELIERIRDAGTALVRVFLGPYGKSGTGYWQECSAFFGAIHRTGAIPMIAFAGPQSWNDVNTARKFSKDCGEFVERSIDRWGQHTVASWFWSIGDEPNSSCACGGPTFEAYRDIYEMTAHEIWQRLGCTKERPRIGGPCVDGFQPFWFDWIWRFVEEVDDSLIGFVAWNQYGDWREPGTRSAPCDPEVFGKLLLSRTSEYWSRAEAVGMLLEGRNILNICTELNAHSNTDPAVSSRFNQGGFGAVYYGSSLIDLMRGGADGEFLWAGACVSGPYGALDAAGATTPAYMVKKLIARNIRFGDRILFPLDTNPEPELDAVVAFDATDRKVAVIVHRGRDPRTVELGCWPDFSGFSQVTFVSGSSGGPMRREALRNPLAFDGYEVALLHNQEDV